MDRIVLNSRISAGMEAAESLRRLASSVALSVAESRTVMELAEAVRVRLKNDLASYYEGLD